LAVEKRRIAKPVRKGSIATMVFQGSHRGAEKACVKETLCVGSGFKAVQDKRFDEAARPQGTAHVEL
jgi:hypothetical protein